MKKLVLLVVTAFSVFALSSCEDVCVGAECITGETGNSSTPDIAIPYTHINGEGAETDKLAYILFESEVRDYVKYQVAYLSCTCRESVVNYMQVAYFEIDKTTNTIRTISFTTDGVDGHYTPGTWGDSSGDANQNNVTFEMFQDDFFPWLIGKSLEDLNGISVFTNDNYKGVIQNDTTIAETDLIDEFAGSSVSSNNLIRVIKEILEYHQTHYGS